MKYIKTLLVFVCLIAMSLSSVVAQSSFLYNKYSYQKNFDSKLATLGYKPLLSESYNSSLLFKTFEEKKKWYKTRGFNIAIAPAILMGASLATFDQNSDLSRESVRDFRNRFFPNFNDRFDDVAQYLPLLTYYGLNAFDVKGKYTVKRTTATAAMSYAMMGIVVGVMKASIDVLRPDGSTNNSYPSGHTATAFVGAHLFAKEYKDRSPLYPIGAYSMAILVGTYRQLNNRHWISDVFAGAAIGLLSVDISHLITEKIFKQKGINKPIESAWKEKPMVNPSFLKFKAGGANVTGSFASTEQDIYPTWGIYFGFEGAYFFSKHFGVGAEWSITSFPLNSDNFIIDENFPIKDITTQVVSDAIGTMSFMAGPYVNLPLGKKEKFDIGVHIVMGQAVGAEGAIKARIDPAEQDQVGGLSEVPLFVYDQADTFTFASAFDFRWRINRSIGVGLNFEYHYLRPDVVTRDVTNVTQQGAVTLGDVVDSGKVNQDFITSGVTFYAFLW